MFLHGLRIGISSFLLLYGCSSNIRNQADVSVENERPNIIIILADDLGYSDIGCYGGEIETPNIDQLGREGIRFTQFYNASRCCPTRASLLTGLYPHETGVGWMTGTNLGHSGYQGFLNNKCVTIAEVLGKAGYQTNMVGKWHVGAIRHAWPENRGFQRFYGSHHHLDSYFTVLDNSEIYENGTMVIPETANPIREKYPYAEWYTTDVFTDKALEYIDQSLKDESPFLLYVAYNAPHWPLQAHDHVIAKYMDKYNGGWDSLRQAKYERMIDIGIVDKNWKLPEHEEKTLWAELKNTIQINSLQVKGSERKVVSKSDQGDRVKINTAFRRAIYAAQIDIMDQNIGRIIQYLKSKGIYDNTVIVFLSDNGSSAQPLAGSDWSDSVKLFGGWNFNSLIKSNYGEWRKYSRRDAASQGVDWALASNTPYRKYKKFIHEGGIATPLIISWPNAVKNPGRLEKTPGHVIDIMPTLLDISNSPYPSEFGGIAIKRFKGISLKPILHEQTVESRESIFFEHEGRAAIRKGPWKLVSSNATTDSTPWELYNMQVDGTETDNLASKFPNIVAALKKEWTEWAIKSDVMPWPEHWPSVSGGKANPIDK